MVLRDSNACGEVVSVRTKQAPRQASGGQGRPKSPVQKGWVIAKEELRSSESPHQNSTNQYTPCSQVQAYQDEDENPPEKARMRKSSQLADAKEPLQPIRPCQLPVFVLTL